MRTRLVLALSVISGIAGAGAAAAADLPYTSRDMFGTQRAAPTVIWSYEPGVTMRRYWLPPWHNHHYYPFSYKRPRHSRKQVRRRYRRPRPAQSYHRVWSNAAAYPCDCAPPRARWLPPPQRRGDRFPPAFAPPNS